MFVDGFHMVEQQVQNFFRHALAPAQLVTEPLDKQFKKRLANNLKSWAKEMAHQIDNFEILAVRALCHQQLLGHVVRLVGRLALVEHNVVV